MLYKYLSLNFTSSLLESRQKQLRCVLVGNLIGVYDYEHDYFVLTLQDDVNVKKLYPLPYTHDMGENYTIK